MVEDKGLKGKALFYDGATLCQFRHNGNDEAARNPVSTYREVQIKHKPGKRGKEGRYDVIVAMSSLVPLSIPKSEKPALDELIGALQASRSQ